MIPEIDIWRVANLMLTRYGDEALAEGTKRAEELAADGDLAGVAVWLRVIDAIRQLAITTPIGSVLECRVPRMPDPGEEPATIGFGESEPAAVT